MEYVGLENITFAFEDPLMWTSLENTIWLAVASGVPQHLVAIPLAYLINEYFGEISRRGYGCILCALHYFNRGHLDYVHDPVLDRLRSGKRRSSKASPRGNRWL